MAQSKAKRAIVEVAGRRYRGELRPVKGGVEARLPYHPDIVVGAPADTGEKALAVKAVKVADDGTTAVATLG